MRSYVSNAMCCSWKRWTRTTLTIVALITRVKFYGGESEIKPMLRVLLVCDHGNGHDDNAVMAKGLDSGKVIGHLEKRCCCCPNYIQLSSWFINNSVSLFSRCSLK